MKLIYAIINKGDSSIVASELTKAGFFATKISSTGGFLQKGNITFMIAIEKENVDEAIKIISTFSKKRKQISPPPMSYGANHITNYSSYPFEVSVGGATIFVTNIERFEKI